MLRDDDFVGAGVNTSGLDFTTVTNICRSEVPLGSFGLIRCIREVPDGVC